MECGRSCLLPVQQGPQEAQERKEEAMVEPNKKETRAHEAIRTTQSGQDAMRHTIRANEATQDARGHTTRAIKANKHHDQEQDAGGHKSHSGPTGLHVDRHQHMKPTSLAFGQLVHIAIQFGLQGQLISTGGSCAVKKRLFGLS